MYHAIWLHHVKITDPVTIIKQFEMVITAHVYQALMAHIVKSIYVHVN